MGDVFVSYASSDRERAWVLANALKSQGWSVWWDRNIQLGHDFDLVIEEALDKARCVIVIWTVDSVRSSWVRSEADDAKQRGVLLPVFFDDVRAPLAFRRIQSTFLVGWDGDVEDPAFQKLAAAVAAMVRDGAAPLPEMPEEITPPVREPAPEPLALKEPKAPEPRPDPRVDLPVATVPHDEPTPPLYPPRAKRRFWLAFAALFLLVAGWETSIRLRSSPPAAGESRNPISTVDAREPLPPPQEPPAVQRTPPPSSPPPEVVASKPATPPPATTMPPATPPRHSPGERQADRSSGVTFRYVPAGGRIGYDYWIGETEVTHGDWKRHMGDNPAYFADRSLAGLPMEYVTWYDTLRFANVLSVKAGLAECYRVDAANVRFTGVTCSGYRIPTEDEWERAARAGSSGRFHVGNTLSAAQANFGKQDVTRVVASFNPNDWGLFDVHGNVWEWTWEKVARGGAYDSRDTDCQLTSRQLHDPGYRERNLGFRLVRTAK